MRARRSRSALGSFQQQVLYVLMRLGERAYGMSIWQELEERTGNSVAIGTLYPILDSSSSAFRRSLQRPRLTSPERLERRGFVSSRVGRAIVCTKRGDTVNGNWGPTSVWDKQDAGSFISDGSVFTGSNNPVAPDCGTPAPTGNGSPYGDMPHIPERGGQAKRYCSVTGRQGMRRFRDDAVEYPAMTECGTIERSEQLNEFTRRALATNSKGR